MRIIPVIDLQQGQVVHAVAGQRAHYRPLESLLASDCRPASIARAYVRHFGFSEVYVADLDAIAGGEPDWNALEQVASCGLRLIIDVGLRDRSQAARIANWLSAGQVISGIVVALESLDDVSLLPALVDEVGAERAIFSIDLRDGRLLTTIDDWQQLTPADLARAAVASGYRRLLLLDLARVGRATGTGLEQWCQQVTAAHCGVQLIAGGGVRGRADLERLAECGCDAALVCTALHHGALTPADVQCYRTQGT